MAAKRGTLSQAQAEALPRLGPEAVTLFALALARHVAGLRAAAPATPSGMVPVYEKPTTPRRTKRPGAKNGHTGRRRKTPAKIDQHVEQRLEVCPCCGGELQRCTRQRQRIIEDIPEQITPIVTEHTVHRDYSEARVGLAIAVSPASCELPCACTEAAPRFGSFYADASKPALHNNLLQSINIHCTSEMGGGSLARGGQSARLRVG